MEAFINSAESWAEWFNQSAIPSPDGTTDIMPLGRDTPTIYEIFAAVRGKIDQYFVQCQAAALDERFVQRMGWTESELADLDFDDPATLRHVLAKAPLARARTDGTLRFDDPINPYCEQLLQRFRTEVAARILDDSGAELSAQQWREIKDLFEAHQEWAASKPEGPIESLGAEKIKAYLSPEYATAVHSLMADSAATAFDLNNIRQIAPNLPYSRQQGVAATIEYLKAKNWRILFHY